MRFKFVDDLSILELVMLGGWLSTYNFKQHVANDIGIDEHFVSADNLKTQGYLVNKAEWTEQNLMVLYGFLMVRVRICNKANPE